MKIRYGFSLPFVVVLSLISGPIWGVDVTISDPSPEVRFDDDGTDGDNNPTWYVEADYWCDGCFDIYNGHYPFIIEKGVVNNLLYLDSANQIGIRTTTPGYTVDAVGSGIRVSSGAKQILMRTTGSEVDLEAIGASLFLRSSTAGEHIIMNPFGFDGNVGIGSIGGAIVPERKLHLRGTDAVFRMDRPLDTAAFMLVRTNAAGTPLKTFVVGTNASASNNGEFIINDLGAAVSGGGTRRMTITNTGEAIFTGTVLAPSFGSISSRRFKENVEPLADALALVQRLQGVRFVWKDTGRPALGLIAEDVATVLPEVVERESADGPAVAVNYPALVAVLVEAVKDQQGRMDAQEAKLAAYRAEIGTQEARMVRLENRLAEFETLQVRLNQIEGMLIEREPRMAAMPKP